MSGTFIEESKRGWMRPVGEQPNNEQLKLGCLQRISAATEMMSQSYSRLIRERDNAVASEAACRQREQKLRNRIAGLRGAIGRMKRAKEGAA